MQSYCLLASLHISAVPLPPTLPKLNKNTQPLTLHDRRSASHSRFHKAIACHW